MIDRDSARNFVVEKICFVANHGCDFSHWFSGEKKQQKHQVFAPVLSLLLGYTFYNCLISTMDFVTIESPCDEYIYIYVTSYFCHHGQASLRKLRIMAT